MIAEPGTYPRAVELMTALRCAGIECGETHGGVSIYPDDEAQRQAAREICQNMKIYVHDGNQSFAVEFRDAMRAEKRNDHG